MCAYVCCVEEPSEGWRCPACQNPSDVIPTLYKCYCGKLTNPHPRSRGDLTAPHSCADLCGRNLARDPQSSCQHKCQLLCHPGTCTSITSHACMYICIKHATKSAHLKMYIYFSVFHFNKHQPYLFLFQCVGPCPPCPVMVSRSCPCGRQTYPVSELTSCNMNIIRVYICTYM